VKSHVARQWATLALRVSGPLALSVATGACSEIPAPTLEVEVPIEAPSASTSEVSSAWAPSVSPSAWYVDQFGMSYPRENGKLILDPAIRCFERVDGGSGEVNCNPPWFGKKQRHILDFTK
jgi:hypothetical protein